MSNFPFKNIYTSLENFYAHFYIIVIEAEEKIDFKYFIGDAIRDSLLFASSYISIQDDTTLFSILDAQKIIQNVSDTTTKRKPYCIDISLIKKTKYTKGDTLEFGLVIFGNINLYINDILKSLELMCSSKISLLGKNWRLNSVLEYNRTGFDNIIYQQNKTNKASVLAPLKYYQFQNLIAKKEVLKIEFLSPFSMNDSFHLDPSISFKSIIKKSIYKILELSYLYCDTPNDIYTESLSEVDDYLQQTLMSIEKIILKYESYSIPSKNKKDIMPLHGVMGTISYRGKFNFYLPLLAISEYIQIADKTTYGFGKIKLYYD